MKPQVLALLFWLALPAHGNTGISPNALADMMRAMLTMFDMMRLYSNNHKTAPPPAPGWMPAPNLAWPQYPQTNPSSSICKPLELHDLEGEWKNEADIKLAVKQRYARMYWSAQNYKNYYLELIPQKLRFTDAQSGQILEFEVHFENERLILRDIQSGKATYFQRQSFGP